MLLPCPQKAIYNPSHQEMRTQLLAEFKKEYFGMTIEQSKEASKSFIRLLLHVLEILENFVVYGDEIVVFEKTVDECPSRLLSVLGRMKTADPNLRTTKCQNADNENNFLLRSKCVIHPRVFLLDYDNTHQNNRTTSLKFKYM